MTAVGRRQLDHHDTLYCNSIGCPNGFTPIPRAWEMPCDGNVCEVDQCCEAFCSYHACPDGYIPIDNADSIRCRGNECTTRQCCDYRESCRRVTMHVMLEE